MAVMQMVKRIPRLGLRREKYWYYFTATPENPEIPAAGTTRATTSVQRSDKARCGRRIRRGGIEDKAGVGAEAASKPAASQKHDDVAVDDETPTRDRERRGW
jgi:hypothetical protein